MPAQSAWRTPRGFTLVPAHEERTVPQTVVSWSPGPEHDFVLRTGVHPTRATITVFASTKVDTTPVGDGEEYVCGSSSGSGCTLQVSQDDTVLRLHQQVELPAAVVLDVGYASLLPTDVSDGVTSYSASWVLRAREGVK